MRHPRVAIALFALTTLALSACSVVAPKPTLSVERTQLLREDAGAAKVGTVSAGADTNNERIGLRGNSMKSPYNSYSQYLREAIVQDLKEAGHLDAAAAVEISAALIHNDLHTAGFSTNDGEIAAHFVVKRDGAVRYEADKEAKLSWDSSFMGAIAIPRAVQKYPELVGKLLLELYRDPAFIAALKP
jgi:hypothetical protein